MSMTSEVIRIGHVVARVLRLMARGHVTALVATLLFMIGIGALSNVPAIVIGWLVDQLETQLMDSPARLMLTVVGALIGAVLVREILQIVRKLMVENTCTKMEKYVRVSAVRRLLEVDLSFFRHQMSGAIQGRLNRSLEGLVRLIKLVFLDFGPTAFVACTAVGLAVHRHVGMGILMAMVIPIGFALVMAQVNSQKGIRIALLRKKEAIDGTMVELLGNIESVRAIHAIDFEVNRVSNVSEELRQTEIKHHVAMALFDSAKQLNEVIFQALVLALSVYLAMTEKISIGDVVTFSMLFSGVVAPLRELHRIVDEAHENTIRADDLFEILDQPQDRSFAQLPDSNTITTGDTTAMQPPGTVSTVLTISNLSFRYPGKDKDVLQGIDLRIHKGEFVGICGPAGCGKSTLLKAILRLIHPSPGSVVLLGRSIESWNRADLGDIIAYVGQKPFIIDGTVEENITYGLGDIPQERIVEAARLANIHDEISKMPGGYQYLVGEEGAALSGGQRQRIALARVFLRSPSILLLDEATSALDNINERVVQSAVERAMVGRTVIAVAHRLTTLRNADRIIVLDQGEIAEIGNYDQLASADGLFSQFVSAGTGFTPQLSEAELLSIAST